MIEISIVNISKVIVDCSKNGILGFVATSFFDRYSIAYNTVQ